METNVRVFRLYLPSVPETLLFDEQRYAVDSLDNLVIWQFGPEMGNHHFYTAYELGLSKQRIDLNYTAKTQMIFCCVKHALFCWYGHRNHEHRKHSQRRFRNHTQYDKHQDPEISMEFGFQHRIQPQPDIETGGQGNNMLSNVDSAPTSATHSLYIACIEGPAASFFD